MKKSISPRKNGLQAIVLLSGGLDSTVALAMIQAQHAVLLCLTFDYGQRAAQREIEASRQICSLYGLKHEVMELSWMKNSKSRLVQPQTPLPEMTIEDLGLREKTLESAKAVWIPNRNGVFISIAASFAETQNAEIVCVGFNREEATTFPDNSGDFVRSMNKALTYSTLNGVRVVAPTQSMDKEGLYAKAIELKIPLHLLWSCYDSGPLPCGRCESCQRFERARQRVEKTHELHLH